MSRPIRHSEAQAPGVVRLFSNPAAYDHPVSAIEVIETHISWVFLTGAFAYKVKKPVKLPFVDFSTLARRRQACEDELRLNRRLAPSLYVEVVAMGGPAETPKIHCSRPLEYAVKMRQFDSELRLDRQLAAGVIELAQVRNFATTLARFHATLPLLPAHKGNSADGVLAAFLTNLAELESELEAGELARLAPVRAWLNDRRASLAAALNQRPSRFVRECHGDLHLENLVLLENEITAFDALEFSEKLRSIDVIDEVGFLVMDFLAHNRRDLGYVFLNSYLEQSGDYAGLSLINYYMTHRALVRAKVRKIREHQSGASHATSANDYLTLAGELSGRRKPLLLITRGLSGSGKTSVSKELIRTLPSISIRSDIERKRLAGLAPDADSGSGIGTGIYSTQLSDEIYAVLERSAAAALDSSLNVIVDASFLKKSARETFRNLASRSDADFLILDCQAPAPALRARVARRKMVGADASEATVDVLNYQIENEERVDESERDYSIQLDTNTRVDIDSLVERISERTSRGR